MEGSHGEQYVEPTAEDVLAPILAEPSGGAEDNDEEEEHFDMSLAASHSYMGGGLVPVSGRSVLEAGWRGRVPVLAHHGAVFPGEVVPMLIPNVHDAAVLTRAIESDKLFGLLCPDESGMMVSGYGVLCEVFEVALDSRTALRRSAGPPAPPGPPGPPGPPRWSDDSGELLTFKARANHRFRFVCMPEQFVPIHAYARLRFVEVLVLPEVEHTDPLRRTRLCSLDPRRGPPPPRPDPPGALAPHAPLAPLAPLASHTQTELRARSMDAAVTAWPLFLYDMFDYRRLRRRLADYFATLQLVDKMPAQPVALSFWVASNLVLSARDRLALFVADSAALRLHMEVRLVARRSVLCCASCAGEVAARDHIFPMSTDGVHANYTNLVGYMHDIVTVSRAVNTALSGEPSAVYSWFPGYTWTVALCAACMAHVGWRFDAMKRNLRPQQFYGLCRNYVQPRGDEPDALAALPRLRPPPRAL